MKGNPDEAQDVDHYNIFSQKVISYPLHYLCRKKTTPASTMQAMIEVSPSKAFIYRESAWKSTPLHIACWYQMNTESILLLLQHSQEALLMTDVDGNLPIHLAAQHPDASRLVAAFLTAQPATVLRKNGRSQTLLHCLCTLDEIPVKALEQLLDAAPNAAKEKDRLGRLPLHHACAHQADINVFERLIRAFPQAVNSFDHHAMTPYGIVRRRWHWDVNDPRIQLLRKDMIQSSRFHVSVRNQIQFKFEDLAGGKGFLPVRQSHVAAQ